MTRKTALVGADILDGETIHYGRALLLDDQLVAGVCSVDGISTDYQILELDGGCLAPGYIDLQVNGGGGVLFNGQPTLEGIETICAAHRAFGTTSVLVTLITDTPEVSRRALSAGIDAARRGVPGFLGLHLEGPHLSTLKKGAHDPALIRPMSQEDLEMLLDAKRQIPNVMVTVAVENVTMRQITTLSRAGIVVSLGHSAATFEEARAAANAGARCATHLFNAMSPLKHREPGIVGAVLQNGALFAGLIADGYHVDPAVMSIALAAKKGPGRLFLVSDAMSTVGIDATSFTLNDRTVRRKNGRLAFDDGTLAGADLTMHQAVRVIQESCGLNEIEASRMASLYPAQCLAISNHLGCLKAGRRADLIHQNTTGEIAGTWIAGKHSTSCAHL